jgi:predicted RNase H-like HicB family nuclease
MLIEWSEDDQAFVVSFPEFTDLSRPNTHGATYEEAARNGHEVLELVIEDYQARGKPLPELRPTLAGSA